MSSDAVWEGTNGNLHGTWLGPVPVTISLTGPSESPARIAWSRESPDDPYTLRRPDDEEFCTGELVRGSSTLELPMVGTCEGTSTGAATVTASTCPYGDIYTQDLEGVSWGAAIGVTKAPKEPGWYTFVAETADPNFADYSQITKDWNFMGKWLYSFLVVDEEDDTSCSLGTCGECAAGEIHLGSGNLHFNDSDPLPGLPGPLTMRAHDSLEEDIGLFGTGWTSGFESRITNDDDSGTGAKALGGTWESVTVTTEVGGKLTFATSNGYEGDGADYLQSRPKGTTPSELHRDGGNYVFHLAGDRYDRVFDGTTGLLSSLVDRTTDVHHPSQVSQRPPTSHQCDGSDGRHLSGGIDRFL